MQLIDATLVLDADAQEPGRQAARDPPDAPGHLKILADFRTATRAVTQDGSRRKSSSARSFPRPISASARSPWSARCGSTSRPARSASPGSRRRRASRRSPQSKKKGAAGREGAGRRDARSRRPSASCSRSLPGTLFKDRDEFEAALDAAAKKAGVEAARAGHEGDPLRAVRARRDGRHLPRQGRQPRARSRAARHRERAARRERRGVLRRAR